jgi:hypothetical protein
MKSYKGEIWCSTDRYEENQELLIRALKESPSRYKAMNADIFTKTAPFGYNL